MKIARIILCTVFLFSCSQVQSKSKKCDINDYNYVGENSLVILTDGDNNNCGFTLTTPVLTLNRVQEIIVSTLSEQGKNIEVRIAPGIYKNQTVDWTFSMPNHTITFMPLFDDNNRPIFDGEGTKETWFGFKQDKGEKTNLIFNYIRVIIIENNLR